MISFETRRLNHSVSSQACWKSVFLLVLVSLLTLVVSCSKDDEPIDLPMLKGTISSYNEYDGAMLDLTEADMENAGFTPGDIISFTLDNKTLDMPYYDGYYARSGEFLLVAYPSYASICFTVNNFGLPEELRGLEGHAVIVKMKEKGGCLDVQNAMNMKYSNERSDYPTSTDAEFANARAVSVGKIARGVLHRCSTPFTDVIKRAFYVSDYLENIKDMTVLNLADTEEEMKSYDMPPFSRTLWDGGKVILCPLKVDPTAEDYNNRLIAALKELSSRPAPYVVHCEEGKDRTGYVCALLEGLCGATYEEIVADYLITYNNYYGISPQKDSDLCKAILSLRLNPCLMHYASVSDEAQLPNVDYAKAFASYLLSHGMSQQQLDALVQTLTDTK